MIRVTNHAVERYSQRILGKTNASISTMSYEEKDNIRQTIASCITAQNMLYGQLPYIGDNGLMITSDIYLYKNIVPIFDRGTQTVITIYNIDLGFDDKINEKYIKAFKDKIDKIKKDKSKTIEECTSKIRECNNLISYQEGEIERLEDEIKRIKKLEEEIRKRKAAINDAKKLRSNLYIERKKLEDNMDNEVKDLVTTMIKRK